MYTFLSQCNSFAKLAGHVTLTGKMRNAYMQTFGRKTRNEKLLVGGRRMKINPRKIRREDVDWIQLAQDGFQ
jgi:hypothetical protein